jgi:hypothetical protein
VNHFARQTLPTVNRKYFFMNILSIESSLPQNTHNRMLLFGSTPSSIFTILTTETSLWTWACASPT